MSTINPVSNTTTNKNLSNPTNINQSPEKTQTQTYREKYHPLEFYALGKININNDKKIKDNNNINIISNTSQPEIKLKYNYSSHELFNRNLLSVNSPYFDKFKEVKKEADFNAKIKNENNYLNPLLSINVRKEQDIENQNKNNINSLEWFHLIKNKIYIVDNNSNIKKGNNISRNKFYEEKGITLDTNINNNNKGRNINIEKNRSIDSIFNINRFKQGNEKLNSQIYNTLDIENKNDNIDYWKKLRIEKNISNNESIDKLNEKKLKSKNLYFDKNHNSIIRHKNWWQIDENPNKTKISKEAPKWFKLVPQWKSNLFNDELVKKQDTITVFSKNQNWLTVTPRGKDRRNALEKKRILDMDVTSKLMPRWMEIKIGNKKPDNFKSIEYNNPVKTKTKRMMAFVDKDLNLKRINTLIYNPERSIFNYQDFRNDVMTKKEAKDYGEKVSQQPKRFFQWDDGKKFNPRYKHDI